MITTAKRAEHSIPRHSARATAPAIFVIMTFMMWNWWSVYLSGELKSASNRNRQMSIMFGALGWDVVVLIVGVLLLYKVDRLLSSSSARNTAPTPPTCSRPGRCYHFFAGCPSTAAVLTTIIVGVVPVLEPAGHGRQHVHADPQRLRVVVRPRCCRRSSPTSTSASTRRSPRSCS